MSSFFSLGVEYHIPCTNTLYKIHNLIDWNKISEILLSGLPSSYNRPGPTGYDALSIFKAILLQRYHSLSDPSLEEALKLRLDFMCFTGFMVGDSVPDYSTICRFRNLLHKKYLYSKLFTEINNQLISSGLMVKESEGAVIDATIIESCARPNKCLILSEDREEACIENNSKSVSKDDISNTGSHDSILSESESVDADAIWLKKGKKSYYGYKGFTETDSEDGYVRQIYAKSANVSECKELENMVMNSTGNRIYADKAYSSKNNREILKKHKKKDGIMHKANRSSPLSNWQKKFNKIVSKSRYIVEQCFGTLKRKFNIGRAKYVGLKKVNSQLYMSAICFNLLKAVNKVINFTKNNNHNHTMIEHAK